jgi:AcrR family transcriptional regulator
MPRPADRRARIELLRAAEAVFVEHGLAAAKVEDITARAGVSKGAFYLHFESKEDCFRQIVEAFVARLDACIDVPPLSGPGPSPEAYAAMLAGWFAHDVEIFEFCWQNRGLMGMLLSGGGGGQFAYLADAFAERSTENMKALARRLVAAGIYRADVDPDLLPPLISGAYERMIREMIRQPRRPDIEAWVRQAHALITHGVLTPEARAVVDRKVRDGAEAEPPRRSGTGLTRAADPPPRAREK